MTTTSVIRGVYAKRKTLKSGQVRTYYYHRRTGARLPDDKDSLAFRAEVERLNGVDTRPMPAERTFKHLVIEYKKSDWFTDLKPSTQSEYLRHIRYLEPAFGPSPITRIRRHHVQKFMQKFPSHPTLAKAIRRTLSVMLSYAIDELEWMEANLLFNKSRRRKKKIASTGQLPYEEHEIATFREKNPLGSAERLAFEMDLVMGVRINDLTTVPAAALTQETITIRTGKSGQSVVLPVTRMIKEASKAFIAARDAKGLPRSFYALCNLKGGKLHKRTLSKWMLGAYTRAGFGPKQRTHALRYTTAVRLMELGYAYADIADHLGHATAEMARRYCANHRQAARIGRLIEAIDNGSKISGRSGGVEIEESVSPS